jgi:putative ATPase
MELELEPQVQETALERPLADRLRPQRFEDVVGQDHLLGEGGFLRQCIDQQQFPSIIFWGPPGTGKTTLARLMATAVDARFVSLSAIDANTAELRAVFKQAAGERKLGKATFLFVDEIHRFNKAQQDLFLPYMEDGTITLVGATTENPSFALNNALLSRCKVLTLKAHDAESLRRLYKDVNSYLHKPLELADNALEALVIMADGDARYFIGLCESLSFIDKDEITEKDLEALLQRRFAHYDKADDIHYNLLSAFHKSLRSSDVDAALYWAARMLDGGEEPLTIIRRMVAMASEDIGMADPNALVQALSAKQAYEFVGWPDSRQCIAQAIVYLALAPKSNAAYVAMNNALADAKEQSSLTPPMHAMNAPTKMMKEMGYTEGYQYDHDVEGGISSLNYLPEAIAERAYYQPKPDKGKEAQLAEKLARIRQLKGKKT